MDLTDLAGKRLAAYARRSRKEELRLGEQEVSTDQQLREIQQRAKQLRVVIPTEHVYPESGVSAYLKGVKRGKFDEMVEAVASKQVDGVIMWKVDRATRNSTDTARLEELLDDGAIIFSVTEGLMDPSTSMFGLHGWLAKMYSKASSANVQRGKAALARTGKPAGGGRRRFGWEPDGVTHHSAEVELIREAARRVLAGEGSATICKDWNQRGVPTPGGGLWQATQIRRVLLNPRTAGLRVHQGEVMRDDDGQEVCLRDQHGNLIPPILDRATWERLRAVLSDPTRRRPGHPHEYLLSGIAKCGRRCKGFLYGRKHGDRVVYTDRPTNYGGCGGTKIDAKQLDKYVITQTIDWLSGEGLDKARAQLAASDQHRAEVLERLTTDEAELRQLANLKAQGRISLDEWLILRDDVERRIKAAKAVLDANPQLAALSGLPNGKRALQRAWKKMPISQRRAILKAVIDHLIIRPAVRGRNTFDPDRVGLVFRDREQPSRVGWRAGHDASFRRRVKKNADQLPTETDPGVLDTVARAIEQPEKPRG